MSISRATVDQAIQEIQRTQEQSEKQFKEDQITKVGVNPGQRWHPVLNPNREDTLDNWQRQRQRDTRRKYLSVWDDCITKIRSRTWTTRREIAKHYQRSNSWASCLVQLMEHQQVFTAEELRRLLPGNLKTTTRQQLNQEKE